MTRRIVHTVLGMLVLSATFAIADPPKADKKKQWWWSVLRVDPKSPFDAKRMDLLVKRTADGLARPPDLVRAIMQATAQQDGRFAGLIKRKDLRKQHRNLDLALCAYDYALNSNEKALAQLITLDAEQLLGGDYMSIVIMAMIDEWDRTIDSVWRHRAYSDGAAGTTMSMFFECRKELFPESYAKFRASLDTPRKLIERLAATVADDPKLSHDHGVCCRFFKVSDEIWRGHREKTGFCVKKLPREGAAPLIFVSMGPGQSLATKPQRNWILEPVKVEGGPRSWKDITDEVMPAEYKSMMLRARRSDNVIETAPIVVGKEKDPHFGKRGVDLVWEGGKFVVRKRDGEKFTGFSRDPYKPSR